LKLRRIDWSGPEWRIVVVLLAMAEEEDASAFARKREALAYLKKMRGQRMQTPSKSEEV
jgi:hypothetical protein